MNFQSLLNEAKKKAEHIFSINVPIIINEEKLPENLLLERLGDYDCYEDTVIIYMNKIYQAVKMFNLNLEKTVTYLVCHEIGHAKQARIFEDNYVCPWRFKKSRLCRIEIGGVKIPINSEDINLVNNWLQDFCVDKELYKRAISDITARVSVKDLALKGSKEIVTFVQMKNLPLYIILYKFGELSDSERMYIKTTMKDSIGERWDIIYNIMSSLEFSDINAFQKVLVTLIEIVFNQSSWFLPETREFIFKGRNRPSFWNKESYNVLHIFPKKVLFS